MTRSVLFRLALSSVWNRRLTASLTVVSIALSVFLLLGVETLRTGAKQGFVNTISGTDLVVGARAGGVQLLLYSVFRIGNATNDITWESYEDIRNRPEVAWTVPLSLGDSHRGFRVLGTTPAYFERYRTGRDVPLAFEEGAPFADLLDAVIGAQVARDLGYRVGTEIVVAHGVGAVSFADHDNAPFRVVGVLAPTGTPVDRTVHVSLEAIEAIHVGWHDGSAPGTAPDAETLRGMAFEPQAITAALVGLTSPLGAFSLQRWVNDYPEEPLTAILPGVALAELWSVIGVVERTLLAVSALVVATALTGLVASLLAGLNERRREMAVLRAVGAGPRHVLLLLLGEAVALALAGVVLGAAALYGAVLALAPAIESRGFSLVGLAPGASEGGLLLAVLAAAIAAGLLPAWRAYRLSVADGLTPRL